MVILQVFSFSATAHVVSTPGSVRREVSPTSVAYLIYSSRYCGQTSIFDKRTMPSADSPGQCVAGRLFQKIPSVHNLLFYHFAKVRENRSNICNDNSEECNCFTETAPFTRIRNGVPGRDYFFILRIGNGLPWSSVASLWNVLKPIRS